MQAIGGPNSNYEKLFRANMKALEKSIQYRTDRISAILTQAYSSPKTSAAYWRTVRVKLNKEYKALEVLYTKWAKKNIPAAYKASMTELTVRLNRSKATAKRATRSLTDMLTSPRTTQITSILVRDAVIDWTASLVTGKANVLRITRKTQQALLSEALVDSSVARALSTGNLMNNTFIKSINMSDTLAAQLNEMATIIDGEKYVIAGSRRYSPKYYAEMVTRVKYHEAQANAAIQTAKNYKTSLVHISAHNTTTPICQKHEGRIYSINGKDPRFPVLTDVPPYHVNCLHLLFPTFASSMELDGTIGEWEKFSNGESVKPPSPANFVPVDERTDEPVDARAFNKARRAELKAEKAAREAS